jgi:hypothetical protein
LGTADLLLKAAGLRRTLRAFDRLVGLPFKPALTGSEAERAATTAWLVHTTALSWPFQMNCLRRALVLWWLLVRQGIPGQVRVGVRIEQGRLDGHAWVELREKPLREKADLAAAFQAFDSDLARIDRWVE